MTSLLNHTYAGVTGFDWLFIVCYFAFGTLVDWSVLRLHSSSERSAISVALLLNAPISICVYACQHWQQSLLDQLLHSQPTGDWWTPVHVLLSFAPVLAGLPIGLTKLGVLALRRSQRLTPMTILLLLLGNVLYPFASICAPLIIAIYLSFLH